MTLDTELFGLDPSTSDESKNPHMHYTFEHHFDDSESEGMTRIFLTEKVLMKLDAALKLCSDLRTRSDFIVMATLWALESMSSDPALVIGRSADMTGVPVNVPEKTQ